MKLNKFNRFNFWWFLFLVICILYALTYAGYGLDNNDTGFILGLAHQVYMGKVLYSDIYYVRPPISPVLHSIVFHWPLSYAPVYFDRLFVLLQISVYSALTGLIGGRLFSWSAAYTAAVSIVCFLFSAHAFPLMAWHTIDGVFFAVLAVYFLALIEKDGNWVYWLLSIICAFLAAGAKQPFYIVPLIIILAGFLFFPIKENLAVASGSILFGILLIGFALFPFISLPNILDAISSQTSLRDLASAGVVDYLRDFSKIRSLAVALPLLSVLLFAFFKSDFKNLRGFALIVVVYLIILNIGQFYYSATTFATPTSVFDSIFVVTFLFTLAMFFRSRERAWLIVILLHCISWASSISWGYTTTALYAGPSVILIGAFLWAPVEKSLSTKLSSVAIIPTTFFVFFLGHQYYYSLEGVVMMKDNTEKMENVSKKFKFIYSTMGQSLIYSELMNIANEYSAEKFVVLPNIPLSHVLNEAANPIGIDWPLNAEVGKFENEVIQKLDSSVDHVFFFRNARPAAEVDGKFGSRVTLHVLNGWPKIRETSNFSIYQNPHFRKNIPAKDY